jgi:hypothetical protein
MKRRNIMILVLAAALTVCLLAGCSADALMGTGKALGNLRYATADKGGDTHVEDATRTVGGFVERYETLLDWDKWAADGGKRYIDTEGQEKVEGQLNIKSDLESRKKYNDLLTELATNIIAAKESSSSDAALKAALNTLYKDYDGVKQTYKGKAIDWNNHTGMRQVINVVPTVSAVIGMVLPPGSEAITKLYAYSSPFPIQGSELCFIVSEVYQTVSTKMTSFLFDFITFVTQPSGGGGSKVKLEDFKYILDNISASVGDRKDVTVGDKITMCMLEDIINLTLDGLIRYANTHTEGSGADRFKDLNAEWVLANCSDSIDRIYAELEVIGYIYDCNIDLAGLAGKLL